MPRVLAVLTLTVAGMLVGIGPFTARAAFPGSNGRIVFASSRGSTTLHVWVAGADGSGQVQLTSGAGGEFFPVWSPDGSRIAYAAALNGQADIFVMKADGSGQANVTSSALNETEPSWSPDGRRIAFRRDAPDGKSSEIYVMSADGSGVQAVTHDGTADFRPAWSPDGQRIAFTSARDFNEEIYVVQLATGAETRLTNDPGSDSFSKWSPDGTKIAFRSTRDGGLPDIFVMNADGSGQTNLTRSPLVESHPAWSPDGREIVFASGPPSGKGINASDLDLRVMNQDGSNQRTIVSSDGFDQLPDWQSTPVALRFGRVTLVPRAPKAGKTATAKVAVARVDTGEPVSGGAVSCTATIGKKSQRGIGRDTAGLASCTWRLPAAAKGKTLKGSIRVSYLRGTATKRFAAALK